MSQLSKHRTWTTALAVVLASIVMTSADSRHRDAVASPPLAYTQYYCDEWNCQDLGLRVVTPYLATAGYVDSSPTWSPDTIHVAFARYGDVVVMDAAAGTVVNITSTPSTESYPSWSPDGKRLAFASDRDGPIELYVMAPDGADVVRVTTNHGTATGRPAWSADSTRVAFTCQVDAGNDDICAINADGTGFLRLTNDPARDVDPAWSPDGSTIAFATARYGDLQLAFMGPDGSGVAPVGTGVVGWQPAWSPDGRQIAFVSYDYQFSIFGFGLYTMDADGMNSSLFAVDAGEPAWMPTSLFANFTVACSSGLTCTFDASSSFGNIGAYAWSFGDQTSGAGDVVSHTYAVGGQFTVDLTVTDASGATATRQQVISVNQPPVASFTATCNDGLTCLFDWSGSYDPDGWLSGVTWYYGGPVSTVPVSLTTALVTYAAPGSYTATRWVVDNDGASATASQTFTLATPLIHVGDLDRTTTTQKSKWSATVTISVHDSGHQPVANALVTASWSTGGTVSCTTNTAGSCAFTKSNLTPQAKPTLTVTNVQKAPFVYQPQGNHDPDGDSNGTTIQISK